MEAVARNAQEIAIGASILATPTKRQNLSRLLPGDKNLANIALSSLIMKAN
jgi:hypothetical protein